MYIIHFNNIIDIQLIAFTKCIFDTIPKLSLRILFKIVI